MAETHDAARRHMGSRHAAGRRCRLRAACVETHRELNDCRESVDQLSRPRRGRCGVSEQATAGISPRHVAILGSEGLPGGGFGGRIRLELGGCQTDHPRHSLLGEYMSLVEQAIARMRNQARAAAPKKLDAVSKPVAPPLIVDQVPDPASRPAKRMTLNMEALRARGYLPEAARDQQFADHYRRIKRPLVEKAMSEVAAIGEPRVIMVTSALPGDGKTFTSINLALSMALERDISVLLVDCDVAKRHVSDIVGMKEERGLLDALVDESLDIDSLVVQTNLAGLSILPAGRRVEATAELLSSNRMRKIIVDLCTRD